MANDIFEETRRIVAEKAELDPITLSRESVLQDLEIQSLELAEIIFDLEDTFGIEIELNAAKAWEKLKTIGDVTDAISEIVEGNKS
ncbi:MAG: phosphopantetheine-binding protein [Pseudomonadota bacterium]